MAKQIKSYADLAPNSAYELMYEEYLEDIKTTGIVLKHKKSGARICVMANDDENKMFCAAFRTPPENSTGVPHIIEHTVLNGSRNYPSRDPFMQLAKGSLNTFLNAMTYPDKTLYPVASCNDKDFVNLMGVYMDAVFFPNIYKYKQIFQQEGWHYELESPDDELKINGVVYSEMKGAMSSPDGAIWDEIAKDMFPDTTYGVNSGGDPKVIPELTYEYYLNFHRRFYHPSNSYVFLYGNCDMDERLAFMDEKYFSTFDAIQPNSDITKQKRFGNKEPLRITEKYSVGENDDTEGKAFFAYSAMGGSNLDVLECRAWNLISAALINSDGAPIRQALLDAGIGEEIYGGYDSHMIEDAFSVIAKNANAEDADKFLEIVTGTLREQAENGINRKALLAELNRNEFRFREADYGGYPRGLDYASDILQSWLYDDSKAFTYMHVLDDYAKLRELLDTDYYEQLLKKYILNSEHSVFITLLPEQGLVAKNEAELRDKLASLKASMTDEQIENIIAETNALREYQSRPATEEELNCIPCIERTDIPCDTIPLNIEECEIGGCKGVFHDIETNGITYANVYFDMGKIPQEYVPYVSLLTDVIGRFDTKKHTYSELDIDIKLNTGSLGFSPYTAAVKGTTDDYRPMYSLGMRVMADKVAWSFDTALEMICESDYTDKKRMRDILAEIKSDKQRNIIGSGNGVALHRARSYYSRIDCYTQALSGLDYYFFISNLLENYDEKADEVVANLKKIAGYIFNEKNIIVSLAADKDGREEVEKALPKFCAGISALDHSSLGEFTEYVPVNKKEGILIPSQVNYVARAGNMRFNGLNYNAAFRVVQTAVNIDWLYQQIRVKGGAYGCGCGFSGENGNIGFSSYRDPNLENTDAAFCGTGNFVRNMEFDDKELTKFIIGTFSGSERPMSPAGRARRSFDCYITGRTYEEIVNDRRAMLNVTRDQFNEAADAFDKICAQGYFCTVGNENALKEHADLFDKLVNI